MRIITGSARGTRLKTLEGDNTRPTAERVKEAVFSMIQFEIEGRRILDLFAGSGQMGLEALSRGAERAVFVDSSREACDIIKYNISKTHFEKKSTVRCTDYAAYIRTAPGNEKFDIVFVDPPYDAHLAARALSKLASSDLLSDTAIIVMETGSEPDTEEYGQFEVSKTARYAKTTHITILRKKVADYE
ncbi:MAG: 16S rRNA (guanine(966)-N(2))-methyltransferase RsmD [Clostridia bacterium]|nr:16S rRNA (guanine(966)-N(2))-methyltransferase RsmD [Clostridia bacterium]